MGLGAGGEVVPGQHLVFQGGEERLGRGIVETRTDPAHRLPDAEFVLTQQGKARCGIGRAAVTVKDHAGDGIAAAADDGGDLDRIAGQLRVWMLRGGHASNRREYRSSTVAR